MSVMILFAWDQENIECWDLRMPSSQVYSMWTGNNNVESLHWHAPSTSLFAQTSSAHKYEDFNSEERESSWPPWAVHDPEYFNSGTDRTMCHDFDQPAVIQYAFENGRSS